MIWLWIVLGVIAGLALLVFLVGMALPERYEGRAQLTLKRPPEEVWGALADYQKHPMSGKMMRRIETLPDESGLPAWVEDIGSTKLKVRTVEAKAPTYLVREMADQALPMTARGEIRIEPIEGGCRVTATNVTTIRRGTWHVPVFRVIMTLSRGAERSVKNHLTSIAAGLGEKAEFSPARESP